MYLVAIAWIYVVLMMAVAEATHSSGTVLGAIFTFLLYGVMPLAIVMYLLATPARRAVKRAAALRQAQGERAPVRDGGSDSPDGSDHAAGDTVAAERKEA